MLREDWLEARELDDEAFDVSSVTRLIVLSIEEVVGQTPGELVSIRETVGMTS